MGKSLEAKIKEIRSNSHGADAEMHVELAVMEHFRKYPHHQHIIEGGLPSLEEQAKEFLKERFGKNEETHGGHLNSYDPFCQRCLQTEGSKYVDKFFIKQLFLKKLYSGKVSSDIASLVDFPEVKPETWRQKLGRYGIGSIILAASSGFAILTPAKALAFSAFAFFVVASRPETCPFFHSYLQTAREADGLLQKEAKKFSYGIMSPYR